MSGSANPLTIARGIARDARALLSLVAVWESGEGCQGERLMDISGGLIADLGALAEAATEVRESWTVRPVKRVEREEDDAANATAERVSMTLFDVLDLDDEEPGESERRMVETLGGMGAEKAAGHLKKVILEEQLRALRSMISFVWHGKGGITLERAAERLLLITRRYQRVQPMLSQTDLKAVLGKGTRAAVSAAEKVVHDAEFERHGIKGAAAADGGLKSAATKAKNAAAARGNSNRKGKGRARV